jgi:transposase
VPRVHQSQRKKHVRRCAKELDRQFKCLYNCGKEFATDAARNMHMRKKHNEVTKTERDKKAKMIIQTCNLKDNAETLTKLSNLTCIQQD